jgi:hypothetical protein
MKDERLTDAHLRQALAHAPDADRAAPAHVSAQILAAAHRAAAEPAPRPAPAGWARWWSGRPARWGSSGALASVLMAGFVGWMWRDGVPETPRAASVMLTQPAASAAPAVGEAPSSMRAADAPPPSAQEREQAARALQLAREKAQRQQQQRQAEGRVRGAAKLEVPDTESRAPAAPPPAPAVVATAPPPPPPPPPPTPSQQAMDTTPMAAALTPAPGAAPAAAPAMRRAAPPANELVVANPLPPLVDEMRWRVADGPVTAAQLGWLRLVLRLTQGLWTPSPATSAAPEAAAPTVQLLLGDTPQGRLLLGADTLWWCSPTAQCQRAVLGAEAMARLQKELPR